MAIESAQSEIQDKNNWIKWTEQYQTLGQFKRITEFVTGVLKSRLQILEEMVDKNVPNLSNKKTVTHRERKYKKVTPSHMIVKVFKTHDTEKILNQRK